MTDHQNSSADSDGLRTFDTTGTVFRRVGNVLTITCENGEIATRVADQLRTPAQPAPGPGEILQILEDEVYCDKFDGAYDYGDAVPRIMALYASQPSPAATVETCSNCNGTKRATYYSEQASVHEERDCHVCRPQCSAGNWDVECERIEKEFYAKVGRYCTFGPPAERKRQWIILFEDADKGMMIFDDEREAHTAWDRAKDNWTCTLYETAHRKFVFAAGQLRPLIEPQAVPVPPKALHWLGDREDADQTRHAVDMTGCVLYFEQQSDCLQFMRWLTSLAMSRPHGGGK